MRYTIETYVGGFEGLVNVTFLLDSRDLEKLNSEDKNILLGCQLKTPEEICKILSSIYGYILNSPHHTTPNRTHGH